MPKLIYRRFIATGTRTHDPRVLLAARLWARQRIADPLSFVHVGDAWGVDEMIISEFNRAQCDRITVFGWGGQVRHRTKPGVNLPLTTPNPKERNSYMLDYAKARRCVAFWDGQSGGTLDTITKALQRNFRVDVYSVYALHLPKPARLVRIGLTLSDVRKEVDL